MPELLAGGAAVAVTLLLHLVVWRYGLVGRTVRNLVLLFVVGLGASGLLLATGILPALPSSLAAVRALLLAVMVFMVYLSFYSAVELDSTSAVVLLTAEAAGPEGVPEQTLYELLDDEDLIVARTREMVRSRWVSREGDRYRLAPRGRAFIGLVRLVRRTFKDERVGG